MLSARQLLTRAEGPLRARMSNDDDELVREGRLDICSPLRQEDTVSVRGTDGYFDKQRFGLGDVLSASLQTPSLSHKSSDHPSHGIRVLSMPQAHKSSNSKRPSIPQATKAPSNFSSIFLDNLDRQKARAGSECNLVNIAERCVHNIFKCET